MSEIPHAFLVACMLLVVSSIVLMVGVGGRFYAPFHMPVWAFLGVGLFWMMAGGVIAMFVWEDAQGCPHLGVLAPGCLSYPSPATIPPALLSYANDGGLWGYQFHPEVARRLGTIRAVRGYYLREHRLKGYLLPRHPRVIALTGEQAKGELQVFWGMDLMHLQQTWRIIRVELEVEGDPMPVVLGP